MQEHRERLRQTTDGPGLAKLRKLYQRAQDELEGRLRRLMRAQRGETFTALQARALLAQVKEGQAQVARMLAGHAGDLSTAAAESSLRGLERDVGKLSQTFEGAAVAIPIQEAAVFERVAKGRAASLLEQHAVSMRTWGKGTIEAIKDQLAVQIATGASTDDAISVVAETADAQWWRAERIVRTESAWAFNRVAADGVEAAQEALPDLRMQWSELTNEDGAPLDERVAVDSLAMAQQVSNKRTGLFTMPEESLVPDAKGRYAVPDALVGQSWPHGPCRPNGRESTIPWRPGWGIPGWEYVGGDRRWIVPR